MREVMVREHTGIMLLLEMVPICPLASNTLRIGEQSETWMLTEKLVV